MGTQHSKEQVQKQEVLTQIANTTDISQDETSIEISLESLEKKDEQPDSIDDYISKLLDSSTQKGRFTLKNSQVISIIQQARTILLSQPTLLELRAPVKIAGDVLL